MFIDTRQFVNENSSALSPNLQRKARSRTKRVIINCVSLTGPRFLKSFVSLDDPIEDVYAFKVLYVKLFATSPVVSLSTSQTLLLKSNILASLKFNQDFEDSFSSLGSAATAFIKSTAIGVGCVTAPTTDDYTRGKNMNEKYLLQTYSTIKAFDWEIEPFGTFILADGSALTMEFAIDFYSTLTRENI